MNPAPPRNRAPPPNRSPLCDSNRKPRSRGARSLSAAAPCSRPFVRHQQDRCSFAKLGREKRIVLLLFADARDRAVAGTDDGFIGKCQDLFEIIFERVIIGNVAATQRAGEKRIAHDRDWPRQPSGHERYSAGGMT